MDRIHKCRNNLPFKVRITNTVNNKINHKFKNKILNKDRILQWLIHHKSRNNLPFLATIINSKTNHRLKNSIPFQDRIKILNLMCTIPWINQSKSRTNQWIKAWINQCLLRKLYFHKILQHPQIKVWTKTLTENNQT